MGPIVSILSKCIHWLPGFSTQQQTLEPKPYGSVGSGFFNKKIKILYVNGIRNSLSDVEEAAGIINKIAQSQIEFCHASLGLSDAYIATKRIQEAGKKTSSRIHELLTASKTNNVQLLIITHSAGGLVLKEASRDLSEEEKKKITLITLASTYIFPKNFGFQKIINVLNTRDIFPYLGRLRKTKGEITFVSPEPAKKSWSPIQEHFFTAPAYQGALTKVFQMLRQECPCL